MKSFDKKMKELKKDKVLVKEACDNILKVIKNGDVILFKGHFNLSEFYAKIVYEIIIAEARRYFGRNAIVDDVHIMRYLKEDKILNVTVPKAKWSTIEDICLDDITIYHFNEYQYTDEDMKIIIEGMESEREFIDEKTGKKYKMKLIGSKYDVGQLLNFLVNDLAGYDNIKRFNLFDAGKANKVCSVGVGVSEAYLRHYKRNHNYSEKEIPKRPFDKKINMCKFLNNSSRYRSILKNWCEKDRIDIEMYRPSHFANSDYFRNEYNKIIRMKLGKIIL